MVIHVECCGWESRAVSGKGSRETGFNFTAKPSGFLDLNALVFEDSFAVTPTIAQFG